MRNKRTIPTFNRDTSLHIYRINRIRHDFSSITGRQLAWRICCSKRPLLHWRRPLAWRVLFLVSRRPNSLPDPPTSSAAAREIKSRSSTNTKPFNFLSNHQKPKSKSMPRVEFFCFLNLNLKNWTEFIVRVTTTGLPSLAEVREGRQSTIDEASHHDLVSSIDDEERVVMPKPSVSEYLRNKRFYFNYFLTSTTVTSYTFVSTTVTKTVNLLPSPTVSPNLLQCRPSGFAVCA